MTEINCQEACTNGCVLGENCPHLAYRSAASQFIAETPLDRMLEIAEESLQRRRRQPPKWVSQD